MVSDQLHSSAKKVAGMTIQQVVSDLTWQSLRESLRGIWSDSKTAQEGLTKLRKYLGSKPWIDPKKIRRVVNYMGALRGNKNSKVIAFRKEVKKRWDEMLRRNV
tara:strand:- start:799 stop:1110 length:312 start_codon:yes stop_codon:yes gene_type:complete